MANSAKKSTNLFLDRVLLSEAKGLDINLSRAAEQGLRHEIAKAKAAKWKAENAQAIESSNRWVDAHGLPLDRYRQF